MDNLQTPLIRPLVFAVDLDGTLIAGKKALPGALDLVRQLDGRFVVMSNNSTHTPEELAGELAGMGLPIPPERIILAGMMALSVLAREAPSVGLLIVGSENLKREAARRALGLVERNADIVLLARDPDFTYDKLERVANELQRGARLIVTNGDLTHPGLDGAVVPETGSLLQAVLACAPTGSVRVIGKPEAALFEEAIQRLNATAENCVVIGDNPQTDAAGAKRLGLPYLLLGDGPHAHVKSLTDLAELLRRTEAPCLETLREIV